MFTALLLHGWGGNSQENWFPWLQKTLNSKLFDVYTPNLPNSFFPVLEEQEEYIDIYAGDFIDGGYIIGHSLGCQLALNFVSENKIKNSVVILVAPTYPKLTQEMNKEQLGDYYNTLSNYFNTKLNFENINTYNNSYYILLSDNDPLINMQNAKKYYQNLKNNNFIECKNMGHFNKDSGIISLEQILSYIK